MGIHLMHHLLVLIDIVIKCESNTGSEYSVKFLWSPDSV